MDSTVIDVVPLPGGAASGPVSLQVEVEPSFWYLEPENTLSILINPITYAHWASVSLPGASGLLASPFGDYNGDGIINMVEYALRTDICEIADQNVAELAIAFDPEGGAHTISYQLGSTSDEVASILEVSADLRQWTSAEENEYAQLKQVEGDRIVYEVMAPQWVNPIFCRLNWQWNGSPFFDDLVRYDFNEGSAQATNLHASPSGSDYNPRADAFGGASGISSGNGNAFVRSIGTGASLNNAIAQGHYHEFSIDFSDAPSTLGSLAFDHHGSSSATSFTSNIAGYLSTNGFAQTPEAGDAIVISSVNVPVGQNAQDPIAEVIVNLTDLGLVDFAGQLSVRFYFYDDGNISDSINRIDAPRITGSFEP